ncbi:hypothetical protein AAG570_008386 [Ranatra chinensis]|uniref:Uncharacterized protein n=1 Tax=Ranatra chinensis TaxID=642074 RepID=A0ABD0Z3N1_9HEMI
MSSKRRSMFYQNKKQKTTEIVEHVSALLREHEAGDDRNRIGGKSIQDLLFVLTMLAIARGNGSVMGLKSTLKRGLGDLGGPWGGPGVAPLVSGPWPWSSSAPGFSPASAFPLNEPITPSLVSETYPGVRTLYFQAAAHTIALTGAAAINAAEVAAALTEAKEASAQAAIAQQKVQAAKEAVLVQQRIAAAKEAAAAAAIQRSEAASATAAAIQRSEAAAAELHRSEAAAAAAKALQRSEAATAAAAAIQAGIFCCAVTIFHGPRHYFEHYELPYSQVFLRKKNPSTIQVVEGIYDSGQAVCQNIFLQFGVVEVNVYAASHFVHRVTRVEDSCDQGGGQMEQEFVASAIYIVAGPTAVADNGRPLTPKKNKRPPGNNNGAHSLLMLAGATVSAEKDAATVGGIKQAKRSLLLGLYGDYGIGQGDGLGYGAGFGYGEGVGIGVNHLIEVTKTVAVPVVKPLAVPVAQPVPIPVAHPVAVHVPAPLPVHVPVPVEVVKTLPVPIAKPVPYPVEKPYPVEIIKKIPYPVPRPYPVPVPIYRTKHIYHTIHHGHHGHFWVLVDTWSTSTIVKEKVVRARGWWGLVKPCECVATIVAGPTPLQRE